MASVSRSWLVVMAVACVVVCVFVGCDGGGGGGGSFDRVLRGVVVEDDFEVKAGERVAAEGDVVVQAQTATVAGEIISRPSAGTGAKGGSIAIETVNDITVTGRIQAGEGTAGAATGAGGNGGGGGGVTLYSANGDVTLGGVAPAGQVRPRQAGSASLQSGNGGNGGNGTFGGAGGVGGNIVIECPNGTWHITPGPNMLVFGNGGAGGNGTVPTAQLDSVTIPETLPNAGGDAGRLAGNIGGVDGVTVEEITDPQTSLLWRYARVADDVMGGGDGGNAGNDVLGGMGTSSQRQVSRTTGLAQLNRVNIVGAKGGDGVWRGGNGGSASYTALVAEGSGEGKSVDVTGGNGGTASVLNGSMMQQLGFLFTLVPNRELFGGRGGNATAYGGWGGSGGPRQPGGAGGAAGAEGGKGGEGDSVGLVPMEGWHAGRGGDAYAQGGGGGDGGAGDAASHGGAGGAGGLAAARGGDGALSWPHTPEKHGGGGNAEAHGGHGGNGADGNPPGALGTGGTAAAVGGEYNPVGTVTKANGGDGAAGKLITGPPPTTTRKYGVVETQYDSYVANILRNYYSWTGQLVPNAVHPAATLPVSAYVVPGESAYMNAGRTRLWLGTDVFVHTVNDPLGAATDGPLFVIPSESSSRVCAVWVDETRDLLYALPWWSPTVYVYENAATATTNKNPVRTITLVNLGGPGTGMTGDSAGDRLFIRTNNPGDPAVVGVVDNASTRSGAVTPDRKLTNIATGTVGTGIAYARQQDMLYLGMANGVGRISSASSANGNVMPTMIQGAATGITTDPVSLDVYGDSNVLFVAVNRAALLAFDNASTISGNAAFAKRDTSFSRLIGAATFVEP